jgi:hypothetical protein
MAEFNPGASILIPAGEFAKNLASLRPKVYLIIMLRFKLGRI